MKYKQRDIHLPARRMFVDGAHPTNRLAAEESVILEKKTGIMAIN